MPVAEENFISEIDKDIRTVPDTEKEEDEDLIQQQLYLQGGV